MGSFLQSRRPQYDSYGYMSSSGGGRGSAYQLHKVNRSPPGPIPIEVPPDRRIDNIIQSVKRLQGLDPPPSSTQANQDTIQFHTALLLGLMFPTDHLDAHLSIWKGIFQKYVQEGKTEKGLLEAALKNMDFQVSGSVLDLLMSLFQTSNGNQRVIDFNNFIQCCVIVERHLPKTLTVQKGSTSSSALTKAQESSGPGASTPAAKSGSGAGQNTNIASRSSGINNNPKTLKSKKGGKG